MTTAGSCKKQMRTRPRPESPGARATGGSRITCPPRPALNVFKSDPGVALMLRVKRDEAGAFAELVNEYWSRIFGRFYRSFADRQEAEKFCAGMLPRYRSRKRYQPRARFGTWLFHITQNVAHNALRLRKRHPCVHLNTAAPAADTPEDYPALAAFSQAPSEPLERSELAGVVRAAVGDLAGRQRTAVELHQFQDRTYAQVAAEMSMTPKAAKSLLYRARIQLRALLTSYMQAE